MKIKNQKWLFLILMVFFLFISGIKEGISQELSGKNELQSIFKNTELPGVINTVFTPSASYLGTNSWERIGYAVTGVGDVNGDEFDDFMISAGHWNQDRGANYLILGNSGDLYLNTILTYRADAIFRGRDPYDTAGSSSGHKGDVNGDGYDDIFIGAPSGGAEGNPGYVYLIFGKQNADWGNNFILNDSADVIFDGKAYQDRAGWGVDIIGDLNADGCDEFMISADLNDDLVNDGGAVYLFKGKPSGWQKHIPVSSADAIFRRNVEGAGLGWGFAGVGDVNGDHIPDMAISSLALGEIYLLFGRTSINWGTNYDLANANVIFSSQDIDVPAGSRVGPAGDANGDGYDDILISNIFYDQGKGAVYLIFGKSSGWTHMDLSNADVTFVGEEKNDQAGYSIAGNFDFNSDGYSDILIGAWHKDSYIEDVGKVYMIKGKGSNWQSVVNLSYVGDYFYGERGGDLAGFSVSDAGDYNQDGAVDFLISAPYNSDRFYWSGKVYLFLGEVIYRTIEGSVLYHADIPVSDVIMSINGNPTTQTDGSAHYLLNVVPGGDITVTPSKPAGEDFNEITITSFDAALVARYTVGLESFTTDQKRAADGDQNENITMYDAVQIARYAVGLSISAGVHVGDWIFEPENRYYPNIQQSYNEQDFEAIIIGDIDGSWDPALPKTSDSEALSDVWNKSLYINKDTLTLYFCVRDGFPFLSFDLTLEFDQAAFDFLSIQKGENDKPFQVFSSLDNGRLRIGGFRIEPSEDTGQFVSIQFRIHDPVQNNGSIRLKRLQLNEQMVSGTVVLFESGMVQNKEPMFVVDNNYPNPFNNSTTVQLDVPYEGTVQILVFNEKGSIVHHLLDEPLTAGHHSVKWDGIDDDGIPVASGLYLMTIMYRDSMKTLKILLLK
ncbi:FG-GAP repeat protein [bacterium]|nr:FG-GAP repeat protein [bacterium]